LALQENIEQNLQRFTAGVQFSPLGEIVHRAVMKME
jgi:hypothetical protein